MPLSKPSSHLHRSQFAFLGKNFLPQALHQTLHLPFSSSTDLGSSSKAIGSMTIIHKVALSRQYLAELELELKRSCYPYLLAVLVQLTFPDSVTKFSCLLSSVPCILRPGSFSIQGFSRNL